ncbi:MAG: efflux RND transporter periplasmic adaptor subunit, partial [Betaproteobacteria bacterium HGW-Betaproteobacteria-17]
MRLLPLFTALAVSAALYAVVFERPRLLALVGAGAPAGDATPAPPPAAGAADSAAAPVAV